MDKLEVENRVKRIKQMSGDDEAAHGAEDQLHQDVLHAIATGKAEDPKALAQAALKTKKLEFSRWCA